MYGLSKMACFGPSDYSLFPIFHFLKSSPAISFLLSGVAPPSRFCVLDCFLYFAVPPRVRLGARFRPWYCLLDARGEGRSSSSPVLPRTGGGRLSHGIKNWKYEID